MAVTNAQELLKHELGDLLYAEKQILKTLKPTIRETSHPELRQRLQDHYGETEQQIQNLERAFEAMGLKPRGQKCPGILGIIEEKKEFKEEEDPSKPMLEAFNLGAGLRMEHYEIAGYRSAMALAKALRLREVTDLLKANLDQEIAMAKFIDSVSAQALRMVEETIAAGEDGASEGNGAASRRATSKGAGRGSTSKRSTSKRSTSKRSTGKRSMGKRSMGRRSTGTARKSAATV